MAVGLIKYGGSGNTHAPRIASTMENLKQFRIGLNYVMGFLPLMIDGDPSNVANYDFMRIALGCPDNANAKALYEELQSLNFKTTTDAQQDSVNAAQVQAISKLSI